MLGGDVLESVVGINLCDKGVVEGRGGMLIIFVFVGVIYVYFEEC